MGRIAFLSLTAFLLASTAGAAKASDDDLAHGAAMFKLYCIECHTGVASVLGAPPLSHESPGGDKEALERMILDGHAKMAGFRGVLNHEDVSDLVQYIGTLNAPSKGAEITVPSR